MILPVVEKILIKMYLLKVSMIEHYNFNKAYNNSYILLSIWIPLFVVIFI